MVYLFCVPKSPVCLFFTQFLKIMKSKILLLSVLFFLAQNALFAVKSVTVPVADGKAMTTRLLPVQPEKKSGFFQRISERKVAKKIAKVAARKKSGKPAGEGGGLLFGILSLSLSVAGAIVFLTALAAGSYAFIAAIPFMIAGLILGIIGLVKDRNKGLSLAGLILGGTGFIIALFLTFLALFFEAIF